MDDTPTPARDEVPDQPDAPVPPSRLGQLIENSPLNWRLYLRTPAWRPPTDMYETDEMLIVRIEIAGMHVQDFTIELTGRTLLVRGVRAQTGELSERRAYHQMEIRSGEFVIELELPQHVEADQVSAEYNDGFLRVLLPKSRPRHITIAE